MSIATEDRAMTVSRRVRRSWLVVGSAFTFVMLGFGTLQAVTQVAHDEHNESRSFAAGQVARVEVESDSGDIRIVGTDETRITVVERVSDGLRSTDHSVDIVDDRLVVRATCPGFLTSFCRVDFTIRVPTTVDVVIRADEDVELSDIDGAIDVETGGGSVNARRLGGDTIRLVADHGSVRVTEIHAARVEVSADHGDVSLEFSSDPTNVDAFTDHGDVEVIVPRSTQPYRVDASSEHGSVETPIRTDPTSERTIRASSDHGDVSVRYAASG